MSENEHQSRIVEQFTRQATPFSTAATITNETALRMVVDAGEPGSDETVLDVACGGGIVVCAFAPRVRHARGIDMTPAMLDRARELAAEKGFANVAFDQGEAEHLPYADGAFSRVVTRFSVHHMQNPEAVLREMVRVCAPGGRIVVVDMYAAQDPKQAAAFNELETLRDPSHVRCLGLSELKRLFHTAGLPEPAVTFYELRDEVSNLLARSFPNSGDEAKIVAIFAASARDGRLGFPVQQAGETIQYAYPVAILASVRP